MSLISQWNITPMTSSNSRDHGSWISGVSPALSIAASSCHHQYYHCNCVAKQAVEARGIQCWRVEQFLGTCNGLFGSSRIPNQMHQNPRGNVGILTGVGNSTCRDSKSIQTSLNGSVCFSMRTYIFPLYFRGKLRKHVFLLFSPTAGK